MVIGILQMELLLPDTHSLKDKRSVLSRIKNGVRKQFIEQQTGVQVLNRKVEII
ncbi:MAG: DUF503 family protein [Candidatus Marinimicrobia bacterium]|nr:DUF503 family protein [Candidatus Neomarinimicrobiota bacterium]